jgi:hypothetical protein
MGDRANVLMKTDSEDDSGVYLYTHWCGSSLPVAVQDALKKLERWDDPQYLGRIIFCEMVKGYENDATGWGISGFLGDGAGRILKVNADKGEISSGDNVWTFDEYIALEIDEGNGSPVWQFASTS